MDFNLRGKKIVISDEQYSFVKRNIFGFDEQDLLYFLKIPLTIETEDGFVHPDLNEYIDNHNEEHLTELITKSIEEHKEVWNG